MAHKRTLFLKYFILATACGIFFGLSSPVHAAEFRTDYTVDYFLTDNGGSIGTQVNFKIKITNLTSELIIKKFSLQFPKSFQIGNIKANDDFQEIIPQVVDDAEGKHNITAIMSNPQAGLNTANTLYLNFIQYNLFKINGNVWEVILPTIDNRDGDGDYTVNVHLPAGSHKKISIAKPKPDHITVNDIVWNNPANRTIYAVFGDEQNYSLELRYHLTNPGLTKVYTDIAFPPDTGYQKVYVNSIEPPPANVIIDEDGNYLGRYYLNPKEDRTVYFKGGISVYAEPRDDVRNAVKTQFEKQKKYLLGTAKDWTLQAKQVPGNISTIRQIYDYDIDTLSYNYERVTKNISRLGASQALIYPDQAVCTEYSDVLIALSRENGIYTREIQGYGFSSDQNLRPLSVNSDILHSWPEFYDTSLDLWRQLDPTWEDTSGIDYFNSFDLNHITFAIHGKDPEYPFPAGSYKTDDSTKDINIAATAETFGEKKNLAFRIAPLQIPGLNDTYTMKVYVKNTGNTFLWNMPLSIGGDTVAFIEPNTTVDVLAPYETKELSFAYTAARFAGHATIRIANAGQAVYQQNIPITSSYFAVLKYILMAAGIAGALLLLVKLFKR